MQLSLIQAFHSFQTKKEEKERKKNLLVRIQITMDDETKQIEIYEGKRKKERKKEQ